ncbi:hypothetical protein PCA31118_04824 [Pandoraea captiosa]|uniref:Uncharacterized protein n=1 Tax=Pandoraea captiosa TaxID=2508302 RepID=A0A5E5ALR4_9BURK|nr:hypothetical protein [Pandoraea captiosa]VVE74711.1 hypothetical protein PCA31118_04824 [Pandoraea captiosa]
MPITSLTMRRVADVARKRLMLRQVLFAAIRCGDSVLANCALCQLDGLAGAW